MNSEKDLDKGKDMYFAGLSYTYEPSAQSLSNEKKRNELVYNRSNPSDVTVLNQ